MLFCFFHPLIPIVCPNCFILTYLVEITKHKLNICICNKIIPMVILLVQLFNLFRVTNWVRNPMLCYLVYHLCPLGFTLCNIFIGSVFIINNTLLLLDAKRSKLFLRRNKIFSFIYGYLH